MPANYKLELVGVLGFPVAENPTGVMQDAAFAALGLPWRQLKSEVYALYLAYRDPRTPWYARLWAAGVVGYAFSPIDLIPDFVPVLGYLDDLLIVPLGVLLALRLIPADVMADCRARARAAVIALIWVGLAALAIWLGVRWFQSLPRPASASLRLSV
jgi:uncharacterized membrane protein YkvA (DUF1232 family)